MRFALVRRGHSSTGGAEAYLQRFAGALAAVGHLPVLYTDSAWPESAWPFAQLSLGGASPQEFARRLEEAAPERAGDLVFSLERVRHCDVYRAGDGVHAAWLERRARYEPLWRRWVRGFSRKHAGLCELESRLLQPDRVRLIIANSSLVKNEIVERFAYPAERIAVVPNGVPATPTLAERASLRSAARQELDLADDAYVLLFAGSGWERKGLRFAIQAIDRAVGVQPILLVAGHGRQGRMPRSKRVRYLGPVRGLGRWLAAADVFILPTIYDPFSNACLEAMAAGLPVLTTKANGFSEILGEGEGSSLPASDDVEGFAAAIAHWSDPGLRAAVQTQLREKGARFSVEENLRGTLAALAPLTSVGAL